MNFAWSHARGSTLFPTFIKICCRWRLIRRPVATTAYTDMMTMYKRIFFHRFLHAYIFAWLALSYYPIYSQHNFNIRKSSKLPKQAHNKRLHHRPTPKERHVPTDIYTLVPYIGRFTVASDISKHSFRNGACPSTASVT